MPQHILELAKRLDDLHDQLEQISAKTRSNKRKLELLKLRKKVSREIGRLISINVKTKSQAYRNATAELKKANSDMRRAISDPQKYAAAIVTAAAAIALVGRIREYECPGGGGHRITSPTCRDHPNERPRPIRN